MASPAASQRSFLLLVCGAGVLIIGVLQGRMLLGARKEVARFRASTAKGAAAQADRHLRRAIAYYAPFNPWVDQAIEQLHARARLAEAAGENALALSRYRSLRSAILILRGPGRPHAGRLPKLNQRIAALIPKHPLAAPRLEGAAFQRQLRSRLDRPPEPRVHYTALGLLGFVIWLVGAFALITRGLSRDLRASSTRSLALSGLTIMAGIGLFCLGMGLA